MSGMVLFFVFWLTGFLAGALLGWHLGARRKHTAATAGEDVARPTSPSHHGPAHAREGLPAPHFEEKPGLQRAG